MGTLPPGRGPTGLGPGAFGMGGAGGSLCLLGGLGGRLVRGSGSPTRHHENLTHCPLQARKPTGSMNTNGLAAPYPKVFIAKNPSTSFFPTDPGTEAIITNSGSRCSGSALVYLPVCGSYHPSQAPSEVACQQKERDKAHQEYNADRPEIAFLRSRL